MFVYSICNDRCAFPVHVEQSLFRSPFARMMFILTFQIAWLSIVTAADPAPAFGPPSKVDITATDCRLTLQARSALSRDAALEPLNLGVSVRNRVATLWGPIPTAKLAERSRAIVEKVPGIDRVVDQFVIEKPRDPLNQFLKTPHLPPPLPKPEDMLTDKPRAPSSLTGRDEKRPSGNGPVWYPAKRGIDPATEEAPPTKDAPLQPIAPIPVSPAATAPKPAVERAADIDVPKALDALLKTDQRWLRLRPEVKGRVVHLRGVVPGWDDLQRAAKSISNLPGVERVVLEDVRIALPGR